MKIAMRLLDPVHFRCLNARGTLFTVQKALRLFNVFVDFTNRFVSVSMGKGLGLAAISEACAGACVSIYSRMFVSLPFRTVMAKTQSSLNVLFVALILPLAKPTTRTRSPCAMNSGALGRKFPPFR
jgi:hypothetical protein